MLKILIMMTVAPLCAATAVAAQDDADVDAFEAPSGQELSEQSVDMHTGSSMHLPGMDYPVSVSGQGSDRVSIDYGRTDYDPDGIDEADTTLEQDWGGWDSASEVAPE